MADMQEKKPVGKFLLWGVLSLGLYTVLFLKGEEIQRYFMAGGVFKAALLTVVAILFSLVHGNFTGFFWDVVGIKAKKH
ncbi:hypothetical protein EDD75_1397 [Thermodesulfitimonas autotrophica]|jgi:uncharacterized membrane protein YraQ (UPF0718 family)|uniref:Uncharacterized protein n=1 Tax=Thermodesulfitimonas autotrophica TaxID=1894989 RepID=A0A3N5BGD0_9THEO|nr:hypothetical protein [Thermodesulfitimonas autotrophica]RPF47122.1 hypothetical protein EDD75_1397 [Thermodesulfitimonas autotrophica]